MIVRLGYGLALEQVWKCTIHTKRVSYCSIAKSEALGGHSFATLPELSEEKILETS